MWSFGDPGGKRRVSKSLSANEKQTAAHENDCLRTDCELPCCTKLKGRLKNKLAAPLERAEGRRRTSAARRKPKLAGFGSGSNCPPPA